MTDEGIPNLSRDDLVSIVREAGVQSEMLPPLVERMVEAVEDPEVTMIAVGSFREGNPACKCPLLIAGLYDDDIDAPTTDELSGEGAEAFIYAFDDLLPEFLGRPHTGAVAIVD